MPVPIAAPSLTTFVASTRILSGEVNTNFNLMRGHWLPLDGSTSAFAHRSYQLGDSTNSWTSIYGEKLYLNLTNATSYIQANTSGSMSFFIGGASVTGVDAGGMIHPPKVIAAQTIASGGTIALQAGTAPQYLKVLGSGVATAAAAPFDTTPATNIEVSLIGQNNTNACVIIDSDTAGGCRINGSQLSLGLNDMVSFIYDSTDNRYIEKTRNF